MGDIVGSFSNEALWGIIIVMGIAILLLLGELFYARLQLHSRQERYWWVLGASDMYMFEFHQHFLWFFHQNCQIRIKR